MEKAHGAAAYELLDKGPELLILNISSGADLALGMAAVTPPAPAKISRKNGPFDATSAASLGTSSQEAQGELSERLPGCTATFTLLAR